MIQLLDAMMIMIGCYIITRMMIYLTRKDIEMSRGGTALNLILAISTIGVAMLCILFAVLSFVGTLDLEAYKFQ